MAKIAFEFFAQKSGVINSQINELIDEIKDFLDEHDDIGDRDYITKLQYKLEDIEAEWLDIYDLEEEYNQ